MEENEESLIDVLKGGLRSLGAVDPQKAASVMCTTLDVLTTVRVAHLLNSGCDIDTTMDICNRERRIRDRLIENGNETEAFLSSLNVASSEKGIEVSLEFDPFSGVLPEAR